jgi:chromate transport protein ChrA
LEAVSLPSLVSTCFSIFHSGGDTAKDSQTWTTYYLCVFVSIFYFNFQIHKISRVLLSHIKYLLVLIFVNNKNNNKKMLALAEPCLLAADVNPVH